MKPTLVILAAGMGSRYGGLKQIDKVGSGGEAIIDFTMYDAIKTGFKKIVLIIRKEHEELFEENLIKHVRPFVEVEYAYQDLNDIPEGLRVPKGREKPWGTTHALLACRNIVKEDPFVICNADDFYGRNAFEKVMAFFNESTDDKEYCMCGYRLYNTLSDNGTVTRGFCENKDGYLSNIKEVMQIKKDGDKAAYMEDGQWISCDPNVTVSMNFWGFKPSIFASLNELFIKEFPEGVRNNPLKYEALLPNDVGTLVKSGQCKVKVLTSKDNWFGVTYKEDKPIVVAKIAAYKEKGIYPSKLWEKE